MALEGRVDLAIVWDGNRMVAADIRSQRPQIAARLLQGLPPDAAAARVPLVFSLCAQAQTLASRLALLAAQGQTMDAAERRRRDAAVAAENAHEALWRMLRDWPEWLGEPAPTPAMVAMRRALDPLLRGQAAIADAASAAASCRGLFEERILGEPLAAWRARSESRSGLAQWVEAGATPAARLAAAAGALPTARPPRCLPATGVADFAARLAKRIDEEAFAAAPDWGDEPAETGVAQRQAALLRADGSAAARLLARIADAARAIDALADTAVVADAVTDSGGRGWALVDTARGVLLHVAAVAEGRTAFYRIVAPTEWNFHPQGALPGLLIGAPAATREAAERLGVLAIQALDPCVAHRVEVVDA